MGGALDCPSCGVDNREGARFCIGCGAPLVSRCGSCGSELPAEARFCDGCGAPVTAQPREAEPVAAARKVVTVLFADMSGSTALEEHMDAESVRALVDRIYSALRKDVEEHGGRVVKFTGDGLMAAFGVPDVREDDALRAVTAAQTMCVTFGAMAQEVAQPLTLNVGANTGEVVVLEEDDDVVGDAVNVAARLEGAATGGEILVGEATWRLTRGAASYEAVEPLVVKGKSEPVVAYRLLAVGEPGPELLTTPFVGRQDELSRLLSLFEEAVEANAARLVTIIGSPGLGKTRLARELAAHLSDRAVVREARCDPAGTATFAPVAETIRASAQIPEAAEAHDIIEAIGGLLPEDEPDRDRIAALVGALLGAGQPGSTEQTFWALRRLIEINAADTPRVLIIDDLHWGEPLLLDLYEHMAEWIRTAPVLIVVTGRPELRDIRPSLAEGGRAAAVIALEGLDAGATEELAVGLLGSDTVPQELIARIPSSTEGNPLFVRELVRMLVDDGVLRREGGGWVLTVDAEAIEVPPTIQSLLAARMDRLGTDERTVVELASMVGKEFYKGAVAELAPPAIGETLDSCLERLRRKELVEPTGTYWIDERIYRFHHALIRDAAYRRVLKKTRAELHERLAGWFQVKTQGLLGEHEETIGHHLEQAHEYRRQLGRVDDELGRRAADLLRTAAQRALDRDDLPGAAALSRRALDRLPEGDEDVRAELLLTRCEALLSMGDVTQAGPAVSDFLRIASTPRLMAWGACFKGQLANLTSGGLEETEADLAAAARELTELGDMAGAAKAQTVRATALAGLGRFAECEAVLDEALASARRSEGRRRSVTETLGTAPQAQVWGPNPVSKAGGRCLDLVRLLRITTGSLAVEQTSIRCQAVLEAFRGRADAARAMLRKVRVTLTELGLEHELLETEQYAGIVEIVASDPAAAITHLEAAHEGFRRFGSDVLAAQAAASLAQAHLLLGRDEEAERYIGLAEQLASRDVTTAMAWRGVMAELLARRGDIAEARRLAGEAVRLGKPTDALVDHGMAYRSLARVLRAAGDADGAQRADERASALFERKGATALVQSAGPSEVGAQPLATSAPRTQPVENECIHVLRGFLRAFEHRDWDRVAELLRADFTMYDRRVGLGMTYQGREAQIEVLQATAEVGTTKAELAAIATRGRRLSLVSSTWTGPTATAFGSEFLAVSEIDEEGRISEIVVLGVEELDRAFEELEARFVSGEGARYQSVSSVAAESIQAINDRDWDRLRSLFDDELIFVDHRPASLAESRGGDRRVTELRALLELLSSHRARGRAYHALTDTAGVGELEIRGTTADGTEAEIAYQMLFESPAGLITRMEIFPLEELDTALARLDELGTEHRTLAPTLSNRATELVQQANDAFNRRDRDAFARLLSEGCTHEDRRKGLGHVISGRQPLLDNFDAVHSLGPARRTFTPMALRGERLVLALTRYGDAHAGIETEMLRINYLDEEGRFGGSIDFDPDDLDAAFTELDERFSQGEAADASDAVLLGARFMRANNGRDWTALRELAADDFVLIDHRPASLGEIRDPDAWLESVKVLTELAETYRADLVAYHAWSRQTALVEFRNHGVTKDGAIFEQRLLVVTSVRGGRINLVEYFPLEAFDMAFARFESLRRARERLTNRAARAAADATTLLDGPVEPGDELPVPPAADGHSLQNESSIADHRLADCVSRRDWRGVEDLYDDALEMEDRRRLFQGKADKQRQIDQMKVATDLGVAEVDIDVLAIRGDRLSLSRFNFRGRGGKRGFETEILVVSEVNTEGRIVAGIVLDIDALGSALDELDDRYMAGEGAEHAHLVSLWRRYLQAYNERDWDGLRALLSPDIALVDERPASMGRVEGADGYMRAMNELSGPIPGRAGYVSNVPASGPHGGIATVRLTGTTPDGAMTTETMHLVGVLSDGLFTRMDLFAAEALDLALQRHEELTTAAVLENRCTRAMRVIDDCIVRRDWESVGRHLTPEMVFEDRRPGFRMTVRGDGQIEHLKALAAIGVERVDRTLLATRGENLALSEVVFGGADGGSFVGELLAVEEVDALGRAVGAVVFDPSDLGDAFTELDQRFVAGEGAPYVGTFRLAGLQLDALETGDWDTYRSLIAGDVVLVDHRQTSLGEVHGRDDIVRAVQTLSRLVRNMRARIRAIHAIAHGLLLTETVAIGNAEHGGQVDATHLRIQQWREGLVVRIELFPVEALDAARARFDELGSQI